MAERLARLAAGSDPSVNIYANSARAYLYSREAGQSSDLSDKIVLQARYAHELLRAGRTRKALSELKAIQATGNSLDLPEAFHLGITRLEALSWLRLGEQENCLLNHSAASCLLPISGDGVHALPEGSRKAAALYERLLSNSPQDLKARWLLNIAHMTLGQYPDSVAPAWRLPVESFKSVADFPRFRDAAPGARLATPSLAGGVVVEDLDGDGLLDVMVSGWGAREQLRIYRNRGDGAFEDRTDDSGLVGITGGLNLVHADYDNDGDADVLVLRGGWMGEAGRQPNSLLRNRGDGWFEDVTEASGLLSFHPTQTAGWADYDLDGDLDLFIGNETSGSAGLPWADPTGGRVAAYVHPCTLYRNDGDGAFQDVTGEAGLRTVGFVKGVAWGDVDGDERPDLYLSRYSEPNLLFRNRGPDVLGTWTFEDVTKQAGVADPLHSFPTWFWDYDQDGDLDLFVSGYRGDIGDVAAEHLGLPHSGANPALYQNRGDGTFQDVAATAGLSTMLLAMGASYGDVDGDGFPDFYAGTGDPNLHSLMPNRMFLNVHGTAFTEVTYGGGLGHLQKGHGIAFADIDEDGDQDIFAVMGGAFEGDVYANALFENPGFSNGWLKLQLVGVSANRSALGARVTLRLVDGEQERSVFGSVWPAGSFGSSPHRMEFGLGAATQICWAEIRWPSDSRVQRVEGLQVNRSYRIIEGEAPVDVSRNPFTLGRSPLHEAGPQNRTIP